ncbi:MAG: transposase [Bacteroidota bacterium]|nr:transposase [Bacteroidota bacterium]
MNNSFNSLIKLILPEGLEEYFELTSHSNEGATLHLYLKELNILPTEYSGNKLVSKGFFDAVTIQDFPIRGQSVFLHITRRRWLNEDTGKVVFRNWDLIAQGTRITKDFAIFLKEFSRYTGS